MHKLPFARLLVSGALLAAATCYLDTAAADEQVHAAFPASRHAVTRHSAYPTIDELRFDVDKVSQSILTNYGDQSDQLEQQSQSHDNQHNNNSNNNLFRLSDSDAGSKSSDAAENFFNRIGSAIENAIAPAKEYADMIGKFYSWRQRYNKLRQSKPHMKDSIEVMKEQFALVDKQLSASYCGRVHDDYVARKLRYQAADMPFIEEEKIVDESEFETADFMLKVLKEVISRLDTQLEPYQKQGLGAVLELEPKPEQVDEADVEKSMARLRATAVKVAKGNVERELSHATVVAGFHLGSVALSQMHGVPPELSGLLALVVGTPSLSLGVKYLRDIKFRTALAMISAFAPKACRLDKVANASGAVYNKQESS